MGRDVHERLLDDLRDNRHGEENVGFVKTQYKNYISKGLIRICTGS